MRRWACARSPARSQTGAATPISLARDRQCPCGVLYVAQGERYLAEVAVSAASVRRHMPGLRTAIFCDGKVRSDLFDERAALGTASAGLQLPAAVPVRDPRRGEDLPRPASRPRGLVRNDQREHRVPCYGSGPEPRPALRDGDSGAEHGGATEPSHWPSPRAQARPQGWQAARPARALGPTHLPLPPR